LESHCDVLGFVLSTAVFLGWRCAVW